MGTRRIQQRPPLVVSVNQDPGIGPGRAKGAAVHIDAMRSAFQKVGCRCIGLDEPDDGRLLQALGTQLATGPIDVIYERYALGKSAAAKFAAANDIPRVLEVNAPLAAEQRQWRGGSDETEDARQDAIAMGQACSVLAVSNEVGDYAVARGAREVAVEVFPNGIDRSQFNIAARDDSLLGTLVPENRFVIGFHGRLRPWHGFDMLVEIAAGLLERGRDIHLLIVGEGEFSELRRLPQDRFTRIGWKPHEEIPLYVAAFDALPLTYQPDMPCYFSPLKLREAMACGVVPLVPALGDLELAVEHERTGLVYTAGNEEQLLEQLELLVTAPEWCRELGHNASVDAAGHSWERIAQFALDTAVLNRCSENVPQVG
jgi:glycosyltransferase involved in cell wall biosynthesis